MSSVQQLLCILTVLTAPLYACDHNTLITAPHNFEMKTIENTVYNRERFKNRIDHFISLRNATIYATAISADASFIGSGIPYSFEQAYTDCCYPLAGLAVTCCVQGIIGIGAHYSKTTYEQPIIEQLKRIQKSDQDTIIEEIKQKNSPQSEKIYNLAPVISWLHDCQQKANAQHEHAE